MINKVNTGMYEVDAVHAPLIKDQLEFIFPLCEELMGVFKLLWRNTILTHNVKCSNKLAIIVPYVVR